MNLQKQDVGIWVDVKDELPGNEESLSIKIDIGGQVIKSTGYYDLSDEKWYWTNDEEICTDYKIYWLKEVKAVYPLTEEELEEIKKNEYSKGFFDATKMVLKSITN